LLTVSIVCAVALLLVAGCGKSHPSIVGTWTGSSPDGKAITLVFKIVGTWTGSSPDGKAITLVFKNDKTVVWNITSSVGTGSYPARYIIDYKANPITLEIRDFKTAALKKYDFLGALKFVDSTHFRMSGESHLISESAKPPKSVASNSSRFSKTK